MALTLTQRLQNRARLHHGIVRLITNEKSPEADRLADRFEEPLTKQITPDEAHAIVMQYATEAPFERVRVWNGWHHHEIKKVHAALVAAGRTDEAERFATVHRGPLAYRETSSFSRRVGF